MATVQEALNSLYAQVRQTEQRLAQVTNQQKQLSSDIYALVAAKKQQLNFREAVMNESITYYPKWYALDLTVTAASTAEISGAFTITADGYFFIDRIYATWRETTGNTYRAISSGGIAAMTPAATLESELDFTWEYLDGRTNQSRMNQQIPGDILFRADNDGFTVCGGDPIAPTMQVLVRATPTHVTGIAGILTFIFQGLQTVQESPQVLLKR